MTELYRPYSALAGIVRGDLSDADIGTAVTTLSLGLAVIGKMMVIPEAAKELSVIDITSIGDLVVTIAETIYVLHQGVDVRS
jgi:hypothetical protein